MRVGRLILPELSRMMRFATATIKALQNRNPPHHTLGALVAPNLRKESASSTVSAVFQQLESSFLIPNRFVPTSHCARIGCCTALLEMNVSPVVVNSHCGWVP